MPKIPRLTQQSQYGLGRAATAEDFGAGAAAATAQLGQSVDAAGQIAAQFVDAERRSTVSAQVADTGVRLDSLRSELEQKLAGVSKSDDPFGEIERLRSEYGQRAKEIVEESRGKIRGAPYQQLFAERTAGLAGRFGLRVNEMARARSLERIQGQTVEAIGKQVQRIQLSDDDEERADALREIEDTLANSVASGAYTEAQAANEALQAEEILRKSEIRSASQDAADEIIASTPRPTERLVRARKRYTGDKRDAVVARIKDRNAEDAAEKKRVDEARYDFFVTKAQAGDLSREDAIRAAQDGKLGGSELNVVMNVIEARDKPPKVDPAYYNEINRLAVSDPRAFSDIPLDPSRLGSQFTRMVDLQRSVREKGGLEAGEGFLRARVEEALDVADITDEDTQADFRRKVDEEVAETTSRLGRKPSKLELRGIVDGLMAETYRTARNPLRAWLGINDVNRRFQVKPDTPFGKLPAIAIVPIQEVVESERRDPENEADLLATYQSYLIRLQQGGIPATPENVVGLINYDKAGKGQ